MNLTAQNLTVDGDAIVLRQLVSGDKTVVAGVMQALVQEEPELSYIAANIITQLDDIFNDPSMLLVGAFENGTLTAVLMVYLHACPDFQGDMPGVVGHWELPGVKALANGFSRNGTLLRDFLYSNLAPPGVALYWQQSSIPTSAGQTVDGDWSTNDQLQANKTWKQVYTETITAGSLSTEFWITQTIITSPWPITVTIRKMKLAQ
jgi:hypothetical protein